MVPVVVGVVNTLYCGWKGSRVEGVRGRAHDWGQKSWRNKSLLCWAQCHISKLCPVLQLEFVHEKISQGAIGYHKALYNDFIAKHG